MKKGIFSDLATFVRLHNGYKKPKLDFQKMYAMFPDFKFNALPDFGSSKNYGKAFCFTKFPMHVLASGREAYLTYYEYQDATVNLAYLEY